MPTIRLHIAYDGTAFHGWQTQPNIRTVQGDLMVALAKLHGEPVKLQGASRTDAGVHALGQVASFQSHPRRDIWDYVRGLNALTEDDLAVSHAEVAPDGFNARHDSKGKIYVYRIWNHRFKHPLLRRNHWNVREPLDFEGMQVAAAQMLGERDFSSFRGAGCQAATTTRRVDSVTLTKLGNAGIEIQVIGTAFLKYMVRIMAGTLVDVGRGILDPNQIDAVIEARDRSAAGTTAPARGLTLVEVFYPNHPWRQQPEVGFESYY